MGRVMGSFLGLKCEAYGRGKGEHEHSLSLVAEEY